MASTPLGNDAVMEGSHAAEGQNAAREPRMFTGSLRGSSIPIPGQPGRHMLVFGSGTQRAYRGWRRDKESVPFLFCLHPPLDFSTFPPDEFSEKDFTMAEHVLAQLMGSDLRAGSEARQGVLAALSLPPTCPLGPPLTSHAYPNAADASRRR